MKKQRITLFLDPELIKRARAKALEDNESLSDLVEKVLDTQLDKVIVIFQSTQNASDQDKLRLDQAKQYVNQYNAGTVGMPTIQRTSFNSLPGTVTQEMSEGIKHSHEEVKK